MEVNEIDNKKSGEKDIFQEYHNKKIVVVYGNCHTTVISEILKKCREFSQQYAIYPIKPICEIDSPEYFEHPVFRRCDLFIHQSIQKKNRYGEAYCSDNIIEKLNEKCKIISIPNVYHLPMCFFPQYWPKKEFKINKKTTIFFRDKIIDELYGKKESAKNIVKYYETKDLFSSEDMDSKMETFFEKLSNREKDWDIKIKDYIESNYRKSQLFFDPNHPTPVLLKYIAKEILQFLNIKYDEEQIEQMEVQLLDSYEMPICNSVKKHFDMSYNEKELRRHGLKLKSETMDLKSYVNQYIAFEWQNNELGVALRIKSLIQYLRLGGGKLVYTKLRNLVKRIIKKALRRSKK